MQCIDALYAHTNIPFNAIVVDDSTDLTPQYFAQLDKPNLTYFRPKVKLTECNQVINLALKKTRAPYVVYMGNSTQVEPRWLEPALQIMKQDSKIGLIGFKLIWESTGIIEHAGIDFQAGWPHHVNVGIYEPAHRHTVIRRMPAVGFALVLMRREAVKDGFETGNYIGFSGFDDVDNCFTLNKKGWEVVYCGLGCAYHQTMATRNTPEKEIELNEKSEENRFRFLARWGVPELNEGGK